MKNITSNLNFSLVFFICFGIMNLSYAANKTALDIMREVEAKNNGYGTEESVLKLVLFDSANSKIERELKVSSFEKASDVEYFLLEFLSPNDVKGTKLLTWAYRSKTDDQWIYLTSIRRPKRIIGSNRSASFMGSEFTYEDFTGAFIEKFKYSNLSETTTEDGLVWTLERVPTEKMSYAKQKIYISKKYMNVIEIQYFNETGKKYKQAIFKDFKNYKIGSREMYRSSNVEMKNLINDRKSILIWKDRSFGSKINERVFSKSSLK